MAFSVFYDGGRLSWPSIAAFLADHGRRRRNIPQPVGFGFDHERVSACNASPRRA